MLKLIITKKVVHVGENTVKEISLNIERNLYIDSDELTANLLNKELINMINIAPNYELWTSNSFEEGYITVCENELGFPVNSGEFYADYYFRLQEINDIIVSEVF